MKRFIILLILIFTLTGCGNVKEPEKTETPSASPSTTPTAAVTPEATPKEIKIEDIAVNLVTDMSNGGFKKALDNYTYDDSMKKALNEALLKNQIWGYFIQSYGQFKEITGTLPSKAQGYDIVSVKTTFENAKIYINVVFDSNKLIAGLNYAPDPEDAANKVPDGVVETAVKFGKTDWELPGTLTTPVGDGPFPVVILVHGSGPNDRDETIGPNKPFRDIAWGLAQKGIATLRYDKRTFVYGNKMAQLPDMTVNEETVDDAVLALKFLQSQARSEKTKIYILGHSLGGMMMPRIAGLAPDAAGYVIMSGPVTPLDDIIVEQTKYLSELDGTVTDQEKQSIQSTEAARDIIKSLKPDSNFTAAQLFNAPVSYWIDLNGYDPAEQAKSIEKPLLILQGERDYQVTMKEFNLWKDALGNKNNVTFKSYEGLDHLYLYGTEKSNPQEYNVPGKVDSRAIDDISAWVLK